jgi:hypothetical protein
VCNEAYDRMVRYGALTTSVYMSELALGSAVDRTYRYYSIGWMEGILPSITEKELSIRDTPDTYPTVVRYYMYMMASTVLARV